MLAQVGLHMQELYLLDTCNYELQRIVRSTDYIAEVTFSKDSQLFLVIWDSRNLETDDQQFEVYNCKGRRLASFWDPCTYRHPAIAHLPGSTAAIAHSTNFGLWDLQNGQLLMNVGPGSITVGPEPCRGLVATNNTCSKLVFSTSQSTTLYVYDAVFLALLGTLLPEAGCTSSVPAPVFCHGGPALVWGVYGWLVSHALYDQPSEHTASAYLLPHAGGATYRTVSLEHTGLFLNWPGSSSLSPCGAYFCRIHPRSTQTQVIDVRSGDIVFNRSLMPARQCLCYAFSCWSSCGCRLMVLLHARSDKGSLNEQLFVLQFC